MRRNLSATAVSLLALALPGTALAQDDGVTVDPDSPTAKEYAIPLDSARREAAPAARSTTTTPLFGEGVTPDAEANTTRDRSGQAGTKANATAAGGDGRDGEAANGSAPSRSEDQPALEVVAQAASRPGAPSDDGTPLLVAGGGIALVAAAAGAGFMARRRRDPGT